MDWVEALNKDIDYIEDNLLENITCAQIANHVYVSSSHLQRGFYALTGISIGEYVRNRRLTLAGHELSAKNVKVIDIALKYGYENSESFSKAFSRFHNVTPSQARRNGFNLKSYNRLIIKIVMEGGSVMNYRIEKKEAFTVILKAKLFGIDNSIFGDNSLSEVPTFWDEYFAQGLSKVIPPAMGVCGEMLPESKEFWYGIGCAEERLKEYWREIGYAEDNANEIPDGFEKWTIPANTWAVFKCVGKMPDAIGQMWERIYSEWLPQAKYELIPAYDFEYYTDGDTSSPDYVCEIWVPVREK